MQMVDAVQNNRARGYRAMLVEPFPSAGVKASIIDAVRPGLYSDVQGSAFRVAVVVMTQGLCRREPGDRRQVHARLQIVRGLGADANGSSEEFAQHRVRLHQGAGGSAQEPAQAVFARRLEAWLKPSRR